MEELFGGTIAGVGPEAINTSAPQPKPRLEVVLTQVTGGYLINKFKQPIEVCTTLEEAIDIVNLFFTPTETTEQPAPATEA